MLQPVWRRPCRCDVGAEDVNPRRLHLVDERHTIEPKAPGVDHDLFNAVAQRTASLVVGSPRPLRDHRADPGANGEEPLAHQLPDHLLHGVRMELQGLTDLADRRKGLTGAQDASQDGLGRGEDHLLDG